MIVRFNPGDEVIVVEGELKGEYGSVVQYEDTFHKYFVHLPERNSTGLFSFNEHELEALPSTQQPVEDDDQGVLEVPVYSFGIPQEVFQRHLEYLIGRSLAHVGTVGAEQAFFGFQEFEGKAAGEVLLELMFKLEEGMAMFAQAHILIGRIVTALESVHDQTN